MTAETHHPRKRFGQHFLHDPHIINAIIEAIQPKRDEHLVEIGPGKGILTKPLLPRVKRLDAIELDRDLIPILEQTFGSNTHFHLINQDALQFDYASLTQQHKSLRVVGNLPYNISTPLLFYLLKFASLIKDMHFMLQKEVVDRISAQPGDPAYGRLSVMMQYHCVCEMLFDVVPECFSPPPKVMSAVIRLIPYETPPFIAKEYELFETIVRTAFNQRRKTLQNSLKKLIPAAMIIEAGIDPSIRPEMMSVADFVKLSCLDGLHRG